MNSKPKPEFEWKGGRLILGKRLYHKMRVELCNLAGGKCETCGHTTPTDKGEAHHRDGRGLGGSKRDDRIWIEVDWQDAQDTALADRAEGGAASDFCDRFVTADGTIYEFRNGKWYRRNLYWQCGGAYGCHAKITQPDKVLPKKEMPTDEELREMLGL